MGFAVENLFRDQLADGRGMLESVPAETVCKDETIETGDPAGSGSTLLRNWVISASAGFSSFSPDRSRAGKT